MHGSRGGKLFPHCPTCDLCQILASRTEKRQVGGKAGNTFSVATFAVVDEAALAAKAAADEAGAAGEEFWKTLLPEAVKVGAWEGLGCRGFDTILVPRQLLMRRA